MHAFSQVTVSVSHARAQARALSFPALDGAKLARGSHPHRSLVVLQEGRDVMFSEIRIMAQLALIPTCQPANRSDPHAAGACCQQHQDILAREPIATVRVPWAK